MAAKQNTRSNENPTSWLARVVALPAAVHRDQRGSISITSVFALMFLVMLLGMVMNSGQQMDQKLKMQNTADASTYSGGIVLARSMNTLAFTNHLLSDVFALTAFLREAETQSARTRTPEILANWQRIAPIFASSEFPKFARLGDAIRDKIPHEEQMISTFNDWASAASELMLPVMETILEQRMIPEFQRSLVETTPLVAQYAAYEIARRHGDAWPKQTQVQSVLWRTNVDPVGGQSESDRSTLPVVDPVMGNEPNLQMYFERARDERNRLACTYLAHWNAESLMPFDEYGKMSQFANLWRIFTCGELDRLLTEEYPDTNMPHVLRHRREDITDLNTHLERDFMFVGVAYREQMPDRIPGIFKNPVEGDTEAYAQLMLFVPRRRLIKYWPGQNQEQDKINIGGVPGESAYLPLPPGDPPPPDEEGEREWGPGRQWYQLYPEDWTLFSQNWTVQIVPGTTRELAAILSTVPQVDHVAPVNPPELNSLTPQDMHWLSNH